MWTVVVKPKSAFCMHVHAAGRRLGARRERGAVRPVSILARLLARFLALSTCGSQSSWGVSSDPCGGLGA